MEKNNISLHKNNHLNRELMIVLVKYKKYSEMKLNAILYIQQR